MQKHFHDQLSKDAITLVCIFIACLVVLLLPFGLAILSLLSLIVVVVRVIRGRRPGRYAIGVLVGCMLLLALSLVSFYLHEKVSYEFSSWIPHRSLGIGMLYSLTYAPVVMSAFFGYSSNMGQGTYDPDLLFFLGLTVSAVVIISGLLIERFWLKMLGPNSP